MAYPTKYRYTREHEWIEANGNAGTVGITDHAQDSLGDIVFVELPKVGDKVEKGKVFGSVESVKAPSRCSPIGSNATSASCAPRNVASVFGGTSLSSAHTRAATSCVVVRARQLNSVPNTRGDAT